MPGLASMIEQWDGQAVVCQFDRQAQAWVFIALHDTTLGRPVGGTRMKVYQRPEDGLRDAMRLAEGMTHKWAVIDFPNGGGKAVLALSRPLEGEERVGLLERYAGLLRSLKGSFATGEDLGTTPEDMLVLARECDYVHGYEPDRGAVKDPGPVTAVGVFAGLKAAVRHQLGKPELEGVSVLVQGVGDVGAPLARFCAAAGARLLISDIEAPRAEALAAELKGEVVPADETYATPCDVYAPCAVGGTLNRETIPRLQCRIVAGSANNQLELPEDAELLHERDILYAPDYLINAGGALAFGLIAQGVPDDEALLEQVRGLGAKLGEVFEEAAQRGESPAHAAHRRVMRVLGRA